VRVRRLAPLQHRLTVVVAAVLLGTLAVAGIATYVAFSRYLTERLDDSLRDVGIGPPDRAPGQAPDQVNAGPDAPGQRGFPFVQVISDDGSILRSQAGHDAHGRTFTP
jgi:hypothetical protein